MHPAPNIIQGFATRQDALKRATELHRKYEIVKHPVLIGRGCWNYLVKVGDKYLCTNGKIK